jgi:hypothetical protein
MRAVRSEGEKFKPSAHGFKFANRFPGYPLFFPVSTWLQTSTYYGLCGGMCYAALDFLLAGRSVPQDVSPPEQGSPLHRYLYRRQIASFGPLGACIARFAAWMALPDDTASGTQRRTYDQFEQVRVRLDSGQPVVLGVVYVSVAETPAIWKNHQVLACGYSQVSDAAFDINVYDPNLPQDDSAFIRAERVTVGRGVFGLRCTQKAADQAEKKVRGFFVAPYKPVMPPFAPDA